MRRSLIDILRCPKCRRGSLVPDHDAEELVFGPLRCPECHASFPVAEGVPDLALDRDQVAGFQRGFELPWVARSWERYLRPAVNTVLSRRRLDRDSEYLLYRSLLGKPPGPVLDLACGTGPFARRLAREQDMPPVLALDVSRPMIEEGVAQAREANVRVEFLRAEAPALPFKDASLGAVLHAHALHLEEDATRLFVEVERVLRPGGRYVVTSYLPPGFPASVLHSGAGLHPRGETELKTALAATGLVGFERMLLPPFLVMKVEKPYPG